jgi:hypothetical protein
VQIKPGRRSVTLLGYLERTTITVDKMLSVETITKLTMDPLKQRWQHSCDNHEVETRSRDIILGDHLQKYTSR